MVLNDETPIVGIMPDFEDAGENEVEEDIDLDFGPSVDTYVNKWLTDMTKSADAKDKQDISACHSRCEPTQTSDAAYNSLMNAILNEE